MSKKQQKMDDIGEAIQASGLPEAYADLTEKMIDHLQKDEPAFIEDYEYLIPIRDAEIKYYTLREGIAEEQIRKDSQNYKETYQHEITEYMRSLMPVETASLHMARQMIGETTPEKGISSFNDLQDHLLSKAQEAKIPEQTVLSLESQIKSYLTRAIPEESQLQRLSYNADEISALSSESIAQAHSSPKAFQNIAHRAAFEIYAYSDFTKNPEDVKALFDLWNPNLAKSESKTPPKESNGEESKPPKKKQTIPHSSRAIPSDAEEEDSHKWRNLVTAGAGAALLVGSQIVETPKRKKDANGEPEKLTFSHVARTTAIVLAPFVGLYLIGKAMDNWQRQTAQR